MRVLVTGATGYIGSRIIPVLLDHGHYVVAAARKPDGLKRFPWSDRVEAVHFDSNDPASTYRATTGIDAVLYLVHSMDGEDFRAKDRQAAQEMARACEQNRVQRIVYLSGLIPDGYGALSEHLRSRLDVEEIFLAARIDATVLRAAIILGSGSTSFELIRHMIERLPFTPLPAWMNNRVQPIAVSDVLTVIAAALDDVSRPGSFDIGGPTVMSYPQLLATYARTAGLHRPQIPLPPLPKPAVGRAVAAIAQMPTELVTSLVDSLGHEMIVRRGNAAATIFAAPSQPPLRTARSAMEHALLSRIASIGTDGTTSAEAPAPTDPDWAGGIVDIDAATGRVGYHPHGLIETLGLGVRTRTRR